MNKVEENIELLNGNQSPASLPPSPEEEGEGENGVVDEFPKTPTITIRWEKVFGEIQKRFKCWERTSVPLGLFCFSGERNSASYQYVAELSGYLLV